MKLNDELLDAINNKKYLLKKVEPQTTLGKHTNLIYYILQLPVFDTDYLILYNILIVY